MKRVLAFFLYVAAFFVAALASSLPPRYCIHTNSDGLVCQDFTIINIAIFLVVLLILCSLVFTFTGDKKTKTASRYRFNEEDNFDDFFLIPDPPSIKPDPFDWKEMEKQDNMTTDWQYPYKSFFGGARDDKGNFKGGSDAGRPWCW